MFVTSGDLAADRRYDFARHYWMRGDFAAAADIMVQAVELAPRFASAWFALGEIRGELGDRDGAIAAFRQARDSDPDDRHGAGLHLMRLGVEDVGAMPPAYVRTLFDQYAPSFNSALLNVLNYRGPRVLRDAVLAFLRSANRPAQFVRAMDLGCGTGLAARAFDRMVDEMLGCDLSPGMIAQAQTTGLYSRLDIGDMAVCLSAEPAGSIDLVFAADALVYVADLAPILREAARVLRPSGVLAFTVEACAGEGYALGEGLRYQHSANYLRTVLVASGFAAPEITDVSTRDESGVPVPGLVAVAARAV
jgi:predicted TPR repeat methyltransferase